jgi:isoleucyl-tRNA synthetase
MQGDRFGHVIAGHAVVRRHGGGEHRQAPHHGQDDEQFTLHEAPPTVCLLKRLKVE